MLLMAMYLSTYDKHWIYTKELITNWNYAHLVFFWFLEGNAPMIFKAVVITYILPRRVKFLKSVVFIIIWNCQYFETQSLWWALNRISFSLIYLMWLLKWIFLTFYHFFSVSHVLCPFFNCHKITVHVSISLIFKV